MLSIEHYCFKIPILLTKTSAPTSPFSTQLPHFYRKILSSPLQGCFKKGGVWDQNQEPLPLKTL